MKGECSDEIFKILNR